MEPEPVPWPHWWRDYQFYLFLVLASGTDIGPIVMPFAHWLNNVMDWCHTVYHRVLALFAPRLQPAQPVLHDAQ